MPGKHNAGGCGCCCLCKCGGVCLGTLYVTLANVSMNVSPTIPACTGARTGQTIDQTWYNGVTFPFNFEWDATQYAANNPLAFDSIGSVSRCSIQYGEWFCDFVTGVTNDRFAWAIGVQLGLLSGKYMVYVQLGCYFQFQNGSPQRLISIENIYYQYTGACPTGSYSEYFRTSSVAPGGDNFGAFDFRSATATLVWA